MSGRAY